MELNFLLLRPIALIPENFNGCPFARSIYLRNPVLHAGTVRIFEPNADPASGQGRPQHGRRRCGE